jgi:hypothetical protein
MESDQDSTMRADSRLIRRIEFAIVLQIPRGGNEPRVCLVEIRAPSHCRSARGGGAHVLKESQVDSLYVLMS